MSGTNIGPMRAMENWTPKDTPSLRSGKQSHWPVGGSGRTMSRKGMKSWPCSADGIRHKVRASGMAAIRAKLAARKAAYHAGGKTKKKAE